MIDIRDYVPIFNRLYDKADHYAVKYRLNPNSVVDGEWDAFRHAYVSGELARIYGKDFSQLTGVLNELYDAIAYNQPLSEQNMDLFNNEVGRDLGADAASSDEVAERAYNSLKSGGLITDLSDSRTCSMAQNLLDLGLDLTALLLDPSGTMGLWTMEALLRLFRHPNNAALSRNFNNLSLNLASGSPIILDLNGNGASDTVGLKAGVYFDHGGDGFAENTGWVGSGDGLLVWDRNGNGQIDNGGELFGNNALTQDGVKAANGFEILASYDDNHDGKIDQQDTLWNQLKVWVDSNSDGVTDAGELRSLESLGIASLNTGASDAGTSLRDADGNNQRFVGSFTKTDGTTQNMTDVFFLNDPANSLPENWVATTPEIDALPDSPNQGKLYSLHQAMARDTSGTLQSLVTQFTTETTIAGRNALLEQILLNWANASGIDPDSRNQSGGEIDARHLATLEAVMGQGFVQYNGVDISAPNAFAAMRLNVGYQTLFERIYAELAAQTFLKPYFDKVQLVMDANGAHFDFTAALNDLFSPSLLNHDTVTEFYRAVFASGLTSEVVDYNGLLAQLATSAPQYSTEVADITAQYYTPYNITALGSIIIGDTGGTAVGSLGDDTIFSNNSVANTMYGNDGNDTIRSGYGGNNLIYGGDGNDVITENRYDNATAPDKLYGGSGDDTIVWYSLHAVAGDVIDGGSGTNTLQCVNRDISGITITNMQIIDMGYGYVTLTADQFNSFSTISGWGGTIYAATGGTYDLSQKSAQAYDLYAQSNDGTTLIGNNADWQSLHASAYGNDTLIGGNGSDTFYLGGGVDTVIGGSGSNRYVAGSTVAAGTTITGGSGSNTLSANGNITGLSFSNIQTLQTSYVTLTADQFNSFSTITGWYGTIYAATGGTYDLSQKNAQGEYSLYAQSNDGTTLIGNNADWQYLNASAYGNDTLRAGNGNNVCLYAGNGNDTLIGGNGSDTFYLGSGVDTVIGGSGSNNFVVGWQGVAAGTTITGGSGSNTLSANGNITGLNFSNIQTLRTSYVTLTADQFNSFSTITGWYGTIYAATGGTYDLSQKNAQGEYSLYAQSNDGTTLIGNNADWQYLNASAYGNDTLQAGNGNNVYLYAGNGNDTLIGGSGSDTFYLGSGVDTVIGGSGSNRYVAGSTVAAGTTITNGNGGNAPSGELDMSASSDRLWFERVDGNGAVSATGDDLRIDILGTSQSLTVENWFDAATPGAQLAEIKASDASLMIDTQMALLVQAMATFGTDYASSHGGALFDPTSSAIANMPNDTTLLAAVNAAWHQ